MLKNKLKIPDKTRKPFPDRLGSLVIGFDYRDGENAGSDAALEFGEELETIQPNGFGSDREFEEPDDGVEEGRVQDEGPTGGGAGGGCCGGGEPEFRARQRPAREGSAPVSVLEVIAADEKRSDVQYEISQEEINLEKLQRIASKGLPDEGGLRATTWKLLLGYLPPSRNLWEKELSENRLKYAKLKEDLLISPAVRVC